VYVRVDQARHHDEVAGVHDGPTVWDIVDVCHASNATTVDVDRRRPDAVSRDDARSADRGGCRGKVADHYLVGLTTRRVEGVKAIPSRFNASAW